MKKILFVLLLSTPLFGQITNWQGLTAEQLSNLTAGVTNIASKDYWETYAYAQIRDLYDTMNPTSFTVNDTTPDIEDASFYYTANTSTTVIDSLPFVGDYRKVIHIHIAEAYTTTITHSVGHLDCGGVSLSVDNGDILKCAWNGTKWQVKLEYIE